ncbi:hypothetical protein NEHOM01_2433 [Nematocida homosporus]|uniref:uncharacterized protein n=1 Tax=Nematocida homosporus TaxID=1912981 RepID=UPI002220AA8D|nr:uncharacterized protein NEHOM01_2433 [Nematocida homosporus]KAI5187894.1 hypothetical protein NEHOM01_2433 [Nematocida homosporus]
MDTNQLQETFTIFANEDNQELVQIDRLPTLLRTLGYIVDPETLKNFFPQAITSVALADLEEMIRVQCLPRLSSNEVLSAFQSFDKSNTGKLTISTIKNILSSGETPLTSEEIDTCLELLNPSPDGMVDYRKIITP